MGNITVEEKAVVLLDAFTKTFCRKENPDDLVFRCKECPFSHKEGKMKGYCSVKLFKRKFAPEYIDFGSMGDL